MDRRALPRDGLRRCGPGGGVQLGDLPAADHDARRARACSRRCSPPAGAGVRPRAVPASPWRGSSTRPRTARACCAGRCAGGESTANVVARAGNPRAPRTLVVHAHHDAPQTGRIYDQSLMIALHRRRPQLTAKLKRQLPQWWLGLAAPLGAIATNVSGRRSAGAARRPARLARGGGRGRHLAQPDGARRQRQPLRSGGAGRARRDAARAARRATCACCWSPAGPRRPSRTASGRSSRPTATSWHRSETWFLNLDGVGSPHLMMLEARGAVLDGGVHRPWLSRPDRGGGPRAGHRARARPARAGLDATA